MLNQITERGNFRAKIKSIVDSGNAHGYRFIVHNALRTTEQQKALVAMGHSKTMRSNHLPGPDGLARYAGDAPIVTDDNQHLAYGAMLDLRAAGPRRLDAVRAEFLAAR